MMHAFRDIIFFVGSHILDTTSGIYTPWSMIDGSSWAYSLIWSTKDFDVTGGDTFTILTNDEALIFSWTLADFLGSDSFFLLL